MELVKPIHPEETDSVLKMFLFILPEGGWLLLSKVAKIRLQLPHNYLVYYNHCFMSVMLKKKCNVTTLCLDLIFR